MHSHLTDNILLDDIAAAVGYTSYYLTKKFYRETGPVSYTHLDGFGKYPVVPEVNK